MIEITDEIEFGTFLRFVRGSRLACINIVSKAKLDVSLLMQLQMPQVYLTQPDVEFEGLV